MLKLDHLPRDRGKIKNLFETTTQLEKLMTMDMSLYPLGVTGVTFFFEAPGMKRKYSAMRSPK